MHALANCLLSPSPTSVRARWSADRRLDRIDGEPDVRTPKSPRGSQLQLSSSASSVGGRRITPARVQLTHRIKRKFEHAIGMLKTSVSVLYTCT